MKTSKKKKHSAVCGNSLQSAGSPDAEHLMRYIKYATSGDLKSIIIEKDNYSDRRHIYVKTKQRP